MGRTQPYLSLAPCGADFIRSYLAEYQGRNGCGNTTLDKGMPIELVQALLGHTKIDTTLMYAIVQQHNVRAAHEKYVC